MRAGKTSHCFGAHDISLLSYLITKHSYVGIHSLAHSVADDDPKTRRILDELQQRLSTFGLLAGGQGDVRNREDGDFLVLASRKNVNVSPKGDRGVRVSCEAIALRDGVPGRVVGSITWRKDVPAPKWQMRAVRRLDPLGRVKNGQVERRVLKNEKNAISMELVFSPPLQPGELVSYGFYIWNSRHFALTRREAEDRYKDRWVREGLAVRDPTDQLQIGVELPEGFRVQQAQIEKDPILNQDGPNVPGRVLKRIVQQGSSLEATLFHPETGRYFLSWVPPE